MLNVPNYGIGVGCLRKDPCMHGSKELVYLDKPGCETQSPKLFSRPGTGEHDRHVCALCCHRVTPFRSYDIACAALQILRRDSIIVALALRGLAVLSCIC